MNIVVLSAQTMISGIVKDADGAPIPYVNVLFGGTVIGTITNDAGEFVLSSDAIHNELDVSLLGYSSQKLKLTRKRNHNIVITLVEGEQLNEVVVVLKPKKRLRKKENPENIELSECICGETGTRTLATVTRRQISNLLHYHSGTSPRFLITEVQM